MKVAQPSPPFHSAAMVCIIMMNRTRLITAAAAACLAAATTAQAQSGQRNERERDLPLSAWVDSTALVAALAQIPDPAQAPTVPSVFVLSVNADSTLGAEPLFDGLPEAYSQSIVQALLAHTRVPRGKEISTELLLMPGARARVEAAVLRRFHEPDLINRDLAGRLANQFMETHRGSIPPGSYRAVVRAHLDRQGVAEQIELLHPTWMPLLDNAALDIARQMRFRPATAEGLPVKVWVTIPIVFRS